MSSEQYLWHQTDKNVHVRKCYGSETSTGSMAENCDSSTLITFSIAATFASSPSRELLQSQVGKAWTLLRHQVPGIAIRVFRFPAPDNYFAFHYTVPQSLADADAWVKETVFFGEEGHKTLHEKHCELKDGRFWIPSADHYATELHASPLGDGWHFSLIASHSNMDGRSGFAVLDLFLECLTVFIEGKAQSVADLEWGDEVKRLAPPSAFIPSLVETGAPPIFESMTSAPFLAPAGDRDECSAAPAPPEIPWLYAPVKLDGKGDIARHVELTPELTAKLHTVAKKNGRTITQVVTALSFLAYAEASLNIAGAAGEKRYNEVAQSLAASTHYLVAMYFISHRHKFTRGYDSLRSDTGAPLCSADGASLLVPLDSLKQMLKLDASRRSATLQVDVKSFWGGAIEDAVAGTSKTSLESYAAREVSMHAMLRALDPTAWNVPSMFVSSVGDLARLDLFTAFVPSKARGPKPKPITVTDVMCGLRMRIWPVMNIFYEYDGRLCFHFLTAGEYTTMEGLKLLTDTFENLAAAIVA